MKKITLLVLIFLILYINTFACMDSEEQRNRATLARIATFSQLAFINYEMICDNLIPLAITVDLATLTCTFIGKTNTLLDILNYASTAANLAFPIYDTITGITSNNKEKSIRGAIGILFDFFVIMTLKDSDIIRPRYKCMQLNNGAYLAFNPYVNSDTIKLDFDLYF